MASQKVAIPFPSKGLSENYSFDVQEPGTTRDLLNVRAIDPKTGRTRGAQRAGLSRFLDDQLLTETSTAPKVQDIIAVTKVQTQLTYATLATPTQRFAKGSDRKVDAIDIASDEFGNLYVAFAAYEVRKYNGDGGELAKIEAPSSGPVGATTNASAEITFVAVDDRQNVLVGYGGAGASQADARLHAFEFQLDGTYVRAWTLDTGRNWSDAVFHRNADGTLDLFAFESDDSATTGYFTAYRNVTMSAAPSEDTDARVTLDTGGVIGRRMAKTEEGVVYGTGTDTPGATGSSGSRVWRFDPYGDAPSAISATLDNVSGVGNGIAIGPVNSDGDETVYTIGNNTDETAVDPANVRRIVFRSADNTFQEEGTDAWAVDLATDWDYEDSTERKLRRMRIDTDKNGNVYIPAPDTTGGETVRIYAKEPESGFQALELNSFDDATVPVTRYAVSVLKTRPLGFDEGDSGAGIDEAEFVYVATASEAASSELSFYCYRMAEVTQATGAFREIKLLAIGGGNIETFTQGGSFADPSATGGSGIDALDADAPYIQSIVATAKIDTDDDKKARLRAYISDGKNYVKYDPEDDEVSDWVSTSQGIIPPRCRLVELWQGRAVLARDPENPAAWHMSAIGNPEDWDNFPQNTSPAQAISGVNAKAGDAPDIVNAMLPWDDDLLLFGCDHSIWRLSGNPMLGGRFDLITDQVGMAFGRPWAKDPSGQIVYFMGSYGGVFALQRGGGITRLTRDRIERRMQDSINWGTHYVRLAWNYRDEGLHVFQVPFGAGGTVVKHWFWDRKNDAWFEDQIGTSADTGKQPTAVYLLDGDQADDRVLLIGCEDGRIRAWDEDSPNDDYETATDIGAGGGGGLAIDSYVTIGPIQPKGADAETQFTELTVVLGTDQDGVNFDVFVDDEPEDALDQNPVVSGSLLQGRNPTKLVRFTGESCFLRLRNAQSAQRWAFESAYLLAAPGSQTRVRI